MQPTEYVFRIDVFSPDTLPMARLAEYLAALSKLLGHQENTHFVRVEPGSAKLVHKVDAVDAPKVETRLHQVRLGSGPKEAIAAHQQIEDLLANDNALGTLTDLTSEKVVVPFAGRNRERKLVFPPFRQDTVVQGQIVSIGGRDDTAHATLQDGNIFHTNIHMRRDLARELAPLLYGPIIRLYGNGRFERQNDGVWKVLDFRVDRYDRLREDPLTDVLASIRKISGNGLMRDDVIERLKDIRDGGSEDED